MSGGGGECIASEPEPSASQRRFPSAFRSKYVRHVPAKVNSKGTGTRWYLSRLGRRARRYPSEILFKIREAETETSQDENGHLDSWTVGGRASVSPCSTVIVVDVVSLALTWLGMGTGTVTSGNEGGSTLLPAAFRCHIEFPRCREDVSIELRLCFWVDRLLRRHFARPPVDFL